MWKIHKQISWREISCCLVLGAGEARILLSSDEFDNTTDSVEVILAPTYAVIRRLPSLTEYNSTNVSFFVFIAFQM